MENKIIDFRKMAYCGNTMGFVIDDRIEIASWGYRNDKSGYENVYDIITEYVNKGYVLTPRAEQHYNLVVELYKIQEEYTYYHNIANSLSSKYSKKLKEVKADEIYYEPPKGFDCPLTGEVVQVFDCKDCKYFSYQMNTCGK